MEELNLNENIFINEESESTTVPPSGNNSDSELGISYNEFSSIIDNYNNLIGYSKVEGISLSDFDKILFDYNKNEDCNLSEDIKMKMFLSINENIDIDDSYHLWFNLRLYDTLNSLLDSLDKCETKWGYFNWLFNHPINDNFSFEIDDDGDGSANGWSVTNGTSEIISDTDRMHIQKVKLNANGTFIMKFDINSIPKNKEFYLFLNILTLSGTVDLDINVYYDDFKLRQSYHYQFRYGDYEGWRELFARWETYTVPNYNKIELKFYSVSGAEFYIDNLGIIDDYGSILNPTDFEYKKEEESFNVYNLFSKEEIYLIPYVNDQKFSNIRPYWSVVNKRQLAFFKKILNKKIIIKTHDRRYITGKVVSLNVVYIPDTNKKVFRVKLNIEFF